LSSRRSAKWLAKGKWIVHMDIQVLNLKGTTKISSPSLMENSQVDHFDKSSIFVLVYTLSQATRQLEDPVSRVLFFISVNKKNESTNQRSNPNSNRMVGVTY